MLIKVCPMEEQCSRCSMKEEFYMPMNLGNTAKNEPILKMGKEGYHSKSPKKRQTSLQL